MVNLTNEHAAPPPSGTVPAAYPPPRTVPEAPGPASMAAWDLAARGLPASTICDKSGMTALQLATALARVARWRALALTDQAPPPGPTSALCADDQHLLAWALISGPARAGTLGARIQRDLGELSRLRRDAQVRAHVRRAPRAA